MYAPVRVINCMLLPTKYRATVLFFFFKIKKSADCAQALKEKKNKYRQ